MERGLRHHRGISSVSGCSVTSNPFRYFAMPVAFNRFDMRSA